MYKVRTLMKLGALPIACQQAPGIKEIPVFTMKMEAENLVSDSKVLLRAADIGTDKSFTRDEDTPKEHTADIFHFLN